MHPAELFIQLGVLLSNCFPKDALNGLERVRGACLTLSFRPNHLWKERIVEKSSNRDVVT